MSAQAPTHTGVVVDVLPSIQFRVQIDGTDKVIRCYLAGKMRKFNINVLLGDKVDVVWSGRTDDVARITRRK